MKRLLNWIKSNLFVVSILVVVVGSLGVLGYVFWGRQAFLERLDQRDQEVLTPITKLRASSIQYPPETPGAPLIMKKGFITPGVIAERQEINAAFAVQYETVFGMVAETNHAWRQVADMSDKDKFPLPARAMKDFEDKVIAMFGPAGSVAAGEPRLGAGMPPATTDYTIVSRLGRDAAVFDQTHRSMNAIQAERNQELRAKLLGDNLLQMLEDRAKTIHVYAVPRPAAAAGAPTFALDRQEFPVDLTYIDPARFHGEPPPLGEVWEAQMQLLTIQDVVLAIARTNHADDPQYNVLNAPVKQILRIKVFPGYVTGRVAASASGSGHLETVPGENRGAGGTPTAPGVAGGGTAVAGIVDSDEQPGLTGRKSNDLYDVKHVSVSLIVDYQQLPALFQQLAAVNFMTVLKMQISNVDEYEALKKGYVYGPQDCVKVDMLIESVWFRNWMVKAMPEEIRKPLGASVPTPVSH